METNNSEFNSIQFEKRLTNLKDSQESINSMSAWCLENRQHHKKIVTSWLNVLKRVKIEHRLVLFYLANDVIQYSKRKNYDFVESWSTSLQKATTMVREEKVKHRVLRIFKIWEQRGIYGEEFLTDLSGLISATPAKKVEQDPSEFQTSYLVSKINSCSKLEEDTDGKLKKMKDIDQKFNWDDPESIIASLKDRKKVEDVERDVEDGSQVVDAVMQALNAEIKARKHLLTLLTQAEVFYRSQKGEVKVVANAYKNFSSRVKALKKKLDELLRDTTRWNSPVPSPDINAPSPSPDSDLELPESNLNQNSLSYQSMESGNYAANFYNPIGDQSMFTNNGFSSFVGSNIPFDIDANMFNDSQSRDAITTGNNLIEVVGNQKIDETNNGNNFNNINSIIKQLLPTPTDNNSYSNSTPLLPPPMPPFTPNVPNSYSQNSTTYQDPVYQPPVNSYVPEIPNSYPPSYDNQPPPYHTNVDEYNPEEEVETWENDANMWQEQLPPPIETPESPPVYEKESVAEPIEYHEPINRPIMTSQEDVDHRLLPPPLKHTDKDHHRGNRSLKDVDHRNLISLTGSPRNDDEHAKSIPPPPLPPLPLWGNAGDQDYRFQQKDQDYRNNEPAPLLSNPPPLISHFPHLGTEPPPPPPPNNSNSPYNKRGPPPNFHHIRHARPDQDNVESIDMELSDDDGKECVNSAIIPCKRANFDLNSPRKKHNHIPSLLGSPNAIVPNMGMPPHNDNSMIDDVDAAATNIIDSLNQDDFLEDMTHENRIDNKNNSRNWYGNQWRPPNNMGGMPPSLLPGNMGDGPGSQMMNFRPDFHPPMQPFAPNQGSFPPPPLHLQPSNQQFNHPHPQIRPDFMNERPPFRGGGNSGRGWGKIRGGNNRGGNNINRGGNNNNRGGPGGNRGFSRGRGFRGRGGHRGGFREQW